MNGVHLESPDPSTMMGPSDRHPPIVGALPTSDDLKLIRSHNDRRPSLKSDA